MALIPVMSATSQTQTLELTFTAFNDASWVQMDSIKVMNRTQGGEVTMHWPDTVLFIEYQLGLEDMYSGHETVQVFQNFPNPVLDHTILSMYVPQKEKITLIISDLLGREFLNTTEEFKEGQHSFRFSPGNEKLYFFTAIWQGRCRTVKILSASSHSPGPTALEYLGWKDEILPQKTTMDVQDFPFTPGDRLLYIGYADTLESGILEVPENKGPIEFEFAYGIPCPGTPTVDYGGQVYNTVQIFSQCWMKENLNVGAMILTMLDQTDNGEIEKYCYDNNIDSCAKYGGLYQYDEMMQYSSVLGDQGICPPGWHPPTDEEWKVLEGAVDSKFEIGHPEWDIPYTNRGFDAGLHLRSTSGWFLGGNGTDLYNFSGLPGGCRMSLGSTGYSFLNAFWWASLEDVNTTWGRQASFNSPQVFRFDTYNSNGNSVRCIKDY